MKKLAIIDTFGLLHRAWHAIPNLTTKDGRMVNAAFGFTSILLKLIQEIKPDYIVAAFDLPQETFRHKEFKDYKAQREAPEQDFIDQIDIVEDILKALNIPKLAVPGYEADDVIGSVAKKYSGELDVIIVSGDHDTMQLIDDHTSVFTMKRGINDTLIYDTGAVKERYGLTPSQIPDMKALAGDASDNIPGVKGIGEKGACTLIGKFGSVEDLYKKLETADISPRLKEMLSNQRESAIQSKRLATIVTNLPIKLDLDKAHIDNYRDDRVIALFQKLEFRSLLNKLPGNGGSSVLVGTEKKKAEKAPGRYEIISDAKGMSALAERLSNVPTIAFDTETTGLNPREADILGASFSWADGEAAFVHTRTVTQKKAFIAAFKPILENSSIEKIAHNAKFDLAMLRAIGITPSPLSFDTLIAAYLVSSDRSLKLEDLAFTYLGAKMQNLTELAERTLGTAGTKKNIPVADIPEEELAQYGADDAAQTFRLAKVLSKALEKEKLGKLFREIEMPLIPILALIEETGVCIDANYLKGVEKKLTARIKDLEKKIYKHAGTEFNISSPLQLNEILFEKLAIESKGIKRKKTGLSTAASELEKLQEAHPIIPLISDYRELTKLMSTYVTTLPLLVAKDDRIHTTFNQTIASTGRLSSTDPNLQNIPIRTELGREIRRAFVVPKGRVLVSADYSQIELRLAAVISKDKKMLASFKAGEDIHRRTAAEINGIALDAVTSDQRRNAKEVNFGVIYGLGSNGLAQRTGMSRMEAKQFIERYFDLYKGVKQYIEDTKSFVRTHGYVETLFGRKRKLPEIYSSSPMLVAQAERMAINMPIQGTATGDIIKLAMIRLADALTDREDIKMLLQVHDELVFEVDRDSVREAATLIKKTMESVGTYEIPLIVEVKTGANWADVEPIK